MEDKKRQKEAGENRPNEPPAKKQVFEEDVAGFEAEIEVGVEMHVFWG